MVVIGGITRLTGSGLSMVEWKVIAGAIPPLNDVEWQEAFNKYKQFPEAKLINVGMDLAGFKKIFFWEYIHRMIGRTIGLVFIIPFLIFWKQGKLKGKLFKHCIALFCLGGFQGFVGWFMVKSGLVDVPHVSHFRLAFHLITAFFLYCYLFYLASVLWLGEEVANPFFKLARFKRITIYLLTATTIQIIYGAFMSGLKAGFRFTDFPLMNGDVVPPTILYMEPWYMNFLSNIDMIQFIHRLLAFIVTFLAICLAYNVIRSAQNKHLKLSGILLIAMILIQFTLGVITVMSFSSGEIPIFWATIHQLGALLLLTSEVFLLSRLYAVKR